MGITCVGVKRSWPASYRAEKSNQSQKSGGRNDEKTRGVRREKPQSLPAEQHSLVGLTEAAETGRGWWILE